MLNLIRLLAWPDVELCVAAKNPEKQINLKYKNVFKNKV